MLQKPFALAQLVTAISQLLNESSIPEESRAARLHPLELEKLELPQVASSHYQFSGSAADASPGACVQLRRLDHSCISFNLLPVSATAAPFDPQIVPATDIEVGFGQKAGDYQTEVLGVEQPLTQVVGWQRSRKAGPRREGLRRRNNDLSRREI